MTILFSVSEQCFYDDAIPYPSFPEDVVEVSEDLHMDLLEGMNKDGRKIYLEKGKPVLSDPPPSRFHEWDAEKKKWNITPDGKKKMSQEVIDKNKQSLSDKIDAALSYVNRKQWVGKASLGRLDEKEKLNYGKWLDYIDALNDIDAEVDGEITWPDAPEQ